MGEKRLVDKKIKASSDPGDTGSSADPERFSHLGRQTLQHYHSLIKLLENRVQDQGTPVLIGFSGAQGTGKSTLCDYIRHRLTQDLGLRSVVLSLDDFYLEKQQRLQLSEDVHPLLSVRGVPGTHDLPLLRSVVNRLKCASSGQRIEIPAFDKLLDDRLPGHQWQYFYGRPDLIMLEGWCVGCPPQPLSNLTTPVNALERQKDPLGSWRNWVNGQLEGDYRVLFNSLDGLVFLTAPGMNQVVRWRLEQELALGKRAGCCGMTKEEVAEFVMYYERVTRFMLKQLPKCADVVLTLNEAHEVVNICGELSSRS